ncbi:Guanylate cyclase [Aphelenchoides besseyi]|nr:Guanylate cyclase [Aphelenchoides besseyi]
MLFYNSCKQSFKMIGYMHISFQNMITHYHGAEFYKQVLKSAGFDDVEWVSAFHVYSDEETYRLFFAYGQLVSQTSEEVWEKFGIWMFHYVIEDGWKKVLSSVAHNLHASSSSRSTFIVKLQEFLNNLTSVHFFVDQFAFQSEIRSPSFKSENMGDGSIRLHYYSERKGLYPLVKGMITEAARILFGKEIKMIVTDRQQEQRSDALFEHVIFTLEVMDEEVQLADVNRTDMIIAQPLPMSLKCWNSMFPSHVCFSKTMIIEHCGEFVLREFPKTKNRMTKMSDIFTLIEPNDITLTFKSIVQYINSVFIVQFKDNMLRNRSNKKMFFSLKGQMMLINNHQSILYINSPHLSTPEDLLQTNLYLNDFQRHDATRDKIMLNQTQITQKKLEDTIQNTKQISEELEISKRRFEDLRQIRVPKSIVPESQKYTEVTCLYADIPHIDIILSNCNAQQVTTIIGEMFEQFDRLIEIHSCFKLRGIMENYLVICGASEDRNDHAATALNLAIAMIFVAKEIFRGLNLSIPIRIVVHSGSVLGGLLRQRYSFWSETINFTKRLKEHGSEGQILVTNATKSLATKSPKNKFEFTTKGYVNIENSQFATCTFFLNGNTKKSVWEILGKDKPEEASRDGKQELGSEKEAAARSAVIFDEKLLHESQIKNKLSKVGNETNATNSTSSPRNSDSSICSIQ